MNFEKSAEEQAADTQKVKELCDATVSFISDYAERENLGGTLVVAASMAAASSIIESMVDYLVQNGSAEAAVPFIEGIRRGWSITADRLISVAELSTQEN